jgi:membrane protein DedA with SNARE-associated domain
MEMLHHLIIRLVDSIESWGYAGIYILMTLESTFVPIPSEIVMPPAGYLAYKGEMNIYIATLMGTLGSMTGATINYYLAVWLGRPIILKYGKYVLCPPHKFEKVEKFFLRHGEVGTFTGRLMLGVRHFISVPAGLARMKMRRFLAFTCAGSAIWCGVLAAIGYWIGKASAGLTPEEMTELFRKNGKMAGLIATVVCFSILGAYVLWQRRKNGKSAN